jgi:tRNA (cytidine/uridine-2'-O-)-methyltransferase
MRLVLYQPDIPQNAGTILRLAACWGLGADVIEPCGFAWDDRRLRRSGMDYLDQVEVVRHKSWAAYLDARKSAPTRSAGRLILLSTRAASAYHEFDYRSGDSLLLGQESAGVPDSVRQAAEASVRIPMRSGLRSLNVALAVAIVAGEAMRQRGFPFS